MLEIIWISLNLGAIAFGVITGMFPLAGAIVVVINLPLLILAAYAAFWGFGPTEDEE